MTIIPPPQVYFADGSVCQLDSDKYAAALLEGVMPDSAIPARYHLHTQTFLPAGDPAAVVEVDLATPLCGAVAHTIDKLETHSLAPAARAWLRGGEPNARGKGRDPTPLRWAQVDARLALPFAERIVASARPKQKTRNSRRLYRRESAPPA